MPTPGTVPILDPNGVPREVPADQVDAALQNGGKRAVKMADPAGTQRWVPEDRVAAAQGAGGKLVPPDSEGSFLGSFADSSGLSLLGHVLAHPIDSAGSVIDAAKRVVAPNQPVNMSDNPNPIISGVGKAIDHSVANFKQGVKDYKTSGLSLQTRRDFGNSIPVFGESLEKAEQQSDAGNDSGAMGTMVGIGAGLMAPKVLKEVPAAARATASAVADAPRALSESFLRRVGGTSSDTPIKGDSVTPRQLYDTAKDMGVNLDTAQATDSAVTQAAKKSTVQSLGGASKFEENQQANLQALHVEAEKIPDQAGPHMSREDFGNLARTRLLQDQAALNQQAGALYDDLTESVGTKQPNVADVKTQAQKIIADNAGYYAKHPEMLKGGAGQAWKIIQNLAAEPEASPEALNAVGDLQSKWGVTAKGAEPSVTPPDTWSDLHKLRSDLMDLTRGPEFIGDRPAGWIKQMTSSVDKAMTEGGSGLDAEATQKWRDANDIYARMKQTYDDPKSKLYHVVRAPDGLTAANTLSSVTPAVVRQIGAAAPELVPHLQRQTLTRILNPAGNDVPDLRNLPTRLGRMPKEQLNGVLSPDQVQQLTDLARVSKVVHADINPSGTAKVLQNANEFGAVITGLNYMGEELSNGRPVRALIGGPARIAAVAIKRPIAAALTSPKFTEAVMRATKGPEGWAMRGQAKVLDYVAKDASTGLTSADLDALRATSAGKKLLIDASGRSSGSAAMGRLVAQLAAMKTPTSADVDR